MPETTAQDVRWLSAAEQRTWRSFLDVLRLVQDGMNRDLLEHAQMPLAEYEILVQLSEATDRALRMSELADLVVNSRSRLTHTVTRLEQRGWVRREACPDDGRGVLCVLTDDGFAVLHAAAPGHVAYVRAAVFDALEGGDVEALGRVMARLRASLRG